ncbi:MAG: hypothetical protein ACRDJE_10195 [Dehalococcoidia bacterium]
MTSEPSRTGVTYRTITRDEAGAMLDADTHRYLGIGVKEFARRYHAGEYDDPDDDPFIMRLGFRLEFLQQNDAPVA